MPNYVYNTIRIRGKQEERQRFLDAIFVPRPTFDEYLEQQRNDPIGKAVFKDDPDKFTKWVTKQYEETSDYLSILTSLYPCPQLLVETTSPPRDLTPEETLRRLEIYGATNWYDWCRANWGSKWGDFSTKQTKHDSTLTVLTFESAWRSPQAGMLKMSEQFPTLHFRVNWKEEDVHWGMYSFKNGKVKRYWEGRYR